MRITLSQIFQTRLHIFHRTCVTDVICRCTLKVSKFFLHASVSVFTNSLSLQFFLPGLEFIRFRFDVMCKLSSAFKNLWQRDGNEKDALS